MKSKVLTLKISIFITIISLIISGLFQFNSDLYKNMNNFIVNIATGIFSGSILSVFIYIAEYGTEKTSAMEMYYISSMSYLNKYLKLEYLYFSKESDLLIEYYKYKTSYYKSKIDKENIYNKAIQYYKIDTMSLNGVGKLLEEKLDSYTNAINKSVDSYLELVKNPIKDVNSAYGSMFFFRGQKYRKKIYNDTYVPLYEMRKYIKDKTYHFELYKNGDTNNLLVIVDILSKLQGKIFEIVHKTHDGIESDIVYNAFYEKLDEELELFRAKIYRESPEIVDRCHVCSIANIISDH